MFYSTSPLDLYFGWVQNSALEITFPHILKAVLHCILPSSKKFMPFWFLILCSDWLVSVSLFGTFYVFLYIPCVLKFHSNVPWSRCFLYTVFLTQCNLIMGVLFKPENFLFLGFLHSSSLELLLFKHCTSTWSSNFILSTALHFYFLVYGSGDKVPQFYLLTYFKRILSQYLFPKSNFF